MFRFFVLLLLLLILPDLFIWWNFTKVQSGFWRTFLVMLPTALTLLCMLGLILQVRSMPLMQWAFILIICVAVPKLVFVVANLLGRGLVWHHPSSLLVVHRVAIAFSVLMAAVQVYGTGWGWRMLRTNRVTVHLKHLPSAFDGYRVVQISDLHLGTYADNGQVVRALVDSVNQQKPDLIVFTGDIVNTASAEMLPYLDILNHLQARDGVISVLGNHDYCQYQPGLTPKQQADEVEHIARMQAQMGWLLLRNAHHDIVRGDDTLHVAGVENVGKPPFPERGNLSRALQGVPSHSCVVLLSHDPWHWRHGVVGRTDIDLTLSGHTHALQMQVGSFSPAAWFMPEWGGLYREGSQKLFVSTGIGGNVPYRLGAWPKIEVITLRR